MIIKIYFLQLWITNCWTWKQNQRMDGIGKVDVRAIEPYSCCYWNSFDWKVWHATWYSKVCLPQKRTWQNHRRVPWTAQRRKQCVFISDASNCCTLVSKNRELFITINLFPSATMNRFSKHSTSLTHPSSISYKCQLAPFPWVWVAKVSRWDFKSWQITTTIDCA